MKNRAILLLAALSFISTGASFAPQPIHPIPGSAWLRITREGQSLFKEKLVQVLEGSGLSLNRMQFEKVLVRSQHPLQMQQLLDQAPEARQRAVERLRDEIQRWLLGAELQSPELELKILDLRTASTFDTLSFEVLENLRWGGGVRTRLRARLPSIQIRAAELELRDCANDWLGSVGIREATASLAEAAHPLELQATLTIQPNEQHGLSIEVTDFTTNLAEVPATIDFSPDVRLPRIELSVNGRILKLNPERIIELVRAQKGELIQALQSGLDTLIRTRLPALLQDWIDRVLPHSMDRALGITAPGGSSSSGLRHTLGLGFYPEVLQLKDDGALEIQAATFIEDPIRGEGAGMLEIRDSISPPNWARLARTPHDFALALHPSVINRALSLSADRGLFENIRLSDGSTITLYEQPLFSLDAGVPVGLIRAKLAVQKASGGGFKRLFVARDVRLKFDAFVRIHRNTDGSFTLSLVSLDLESLKVDSSSATLPVFNGLVRKRVQAELQNFQKQLASAPLLLADQVRPPEALAGLRWKLSRLVSDPESGYILATFHFKRD